MATILSETDAVASMAGMPRDLARRIALEVASRIATTHGGESHYVHRLDKQCRNARIVGDVLGKRIPRNRVAKAYGVHLRTVDRIIERHLQRRTSQTQEELYMTHLPTTSATSADEPLICEACATEVLNAVCPRGLTTSVPGYCPHFETGYLLTFVNGIMLAGKFFPDIPPERGAEIKEKIEAVLLEHAH